MSTWGAVAYSAALAGFGAGVALFAIAWRLPRWVEHAYTTGHDDGRNSHAAEIEALIASHGDDLSAATALDLADLGRDLKETL